MIEFWVICDSCGLLIAKSCLSVRAARAEAALQHGANYGPEGDSCSECRIKASRLTTAQYLQAAAAAHGKGTLE